MEIVLETKTHHFKKGTPLSSIYLEIGDFFSSIDDWHGELGENKSVRSIKILSSNYYNFYYESYETDIDFKKSLLANMPENDGRYALEVFRKEADRLEIKGDFKKLTKPRLTGREFLEKHHKRDTDCCFTCKFSAIGYENECHCRHPCLINAEDVDAGEICDLFEK